MSGSRDRNNNFQLEKKLTAYALAGAAVLVAPTAAKANMVTFLNVNQSVSNPGSYAFNLSGANSADITISAGPDFGSSAQIAAATAAGAEVFGSGNPTPLAFGALINPAAGGWGTGGKLISSFGSGSWPSNGSDAYLGFFFQGGGGPEAGWADIATSAQGANSSFEILSYAYETNPNQAITAGQTTDTSATPEPSSMVLIALGGAGLAALRRRRSANA